MSSTNQSRKRFVGQGQTRKQEYHGIFAFTTTGATKTVTVPFEKIEAVNVTAIGAPASDEELSVNNTVSGTAGNDDACIKGSAGATDLTVTRTGASKTSGLKFSLWAVGY